MIQIITTGGTIEGLEYSDEKALPISSRISIKKLIENTSFEGKYFLQNLFSKDSRFITDTDRNAISEIIQNSPNDKILITHGTYTMAETAQFLGKLKLDKNIILTGSFVLGTESETDALENLQFALSVLQKSKIKGVRVAIHNQTFDWDNVRKNESLQIFETIF